MRISVTTSSRCRGIESDLNVDIARCSYVGELDLARIGVRYVDAFADCTSFPALSLLVGTGASGAEQSDSSALSPISNRAIETSAELVTSTNVWLWGKVSRGSFFLEQRYFRTV